MNSKVASNVSTQMPIYYSSTSGYSFQVFGTNYWLHRMYFILILFTCFTFGLWFSSDEIGFIIQIYAIKKKLGRRRKLFKTWNFKVVLEIMVINFGWRWYGWKKWCHTRIPWILLVAVVKCRNLLRANYDEHATRDSRLKQFRNAKNKTRMPNIRLRGQTDIGQLAASSQEIWWMWFLLSVKLHSLSLNRTTKLQ